MDGCMGRKEGKHLLDTSYVPTYFAVYRNFYFLICLIITLQSKNSTHIKDAKTKAHIYELTLLTPKPIFPCSMMVPHWVAVYQGKMPGQFREDSLHLRLAPLFYSVLSTVAPIRVAENTAEG